MSLCSPLWLIAAALVEASANVTVVDDNNAKRTHVRAWQHETM